LNQKPNKSILVFLPFITYLSYIFLIQPLLEARAEIQKYFCWFFGSNEKFRICF
jgi:hypothetical protein